MYKGEMKDFTPEEITSMLLSKMKEIAEDYLGRQVNNAVITVPTYFNISQFQAIKNAGLIANLNIIRIINSPTAAAIAYGLKTKVNRKQNVLVFDLGGGTCNVSLLAINKGIFKVKAAAGSSGLGGKDFDDLLINHFVQEFQSKAKKSLVSNMSDLCRLRSHCELAKCKLSTSDNVILKIDDLLKDYVGYCPSLTRGKFEKLNEDLFQSAMRLIEKVLRDAKIEKNQVHEIVLVGGSTRIPRIQKMISKLFKSKELIISINPDEAAACGAAMQAAILSGDTSENIRDILLLDVNAYTFSIVTSGGIITPFIERNTTLPVKKSKKFKIYTNDTSHADTFHLDCNPKNDYNILIQIFEGERFRSNLLGKFELAASPNSKIEVTFELSINFVLKVCMSVAHFY
jgi:heat shock protein 1/8